MVLAALIHFVSRTWKRHSRRWRAAFLTAGKVGVLSSTFLNSDDLVTTLWMHAWLSEKYTDYWIHALWKLRTVSTWWCPNVWVSVNCLSTSGCLTSIGTLAVHTRDSVGHWWMHGDSQKVCEGGIEDFYVWSTPLDHASTLAHNRICKCDLCFNIRICDTLSFSTYMREYVFQYSMWHYMQYNYYIGIWHYNPPLDHTIVHLLSTYIRDLHCPHKGSTTSWKTNVISCHLTLVCEGGG